MANCAVFTGKRIEDCTRGDINCPCLHDHHHREAIITLLSDIAMALVRRSRAVGSPTKSDGYLECVQFINRRRDEIMHEKREAFPSRPHRQCKWTADEDDGSYDTTCGEKHLFIAGDVAHNNHKFCPYCGGSLKETKET